MKVINKINQMKKYVERAKKTGKTIGFVPTMGYLHEGHLSLMRRARKENDLLIVSIFVNPAQFGEGEDYNEYPRDLKRDKKLAREVGTDVIFAPSVREMYPRGYSTFVQEEKLSGHLCGLSRPLFFRGVTTVVTKLFNIVGPTRAYFGEKDSQQLLIIKRMVKDLNLNVKIVSLPLIREKDGLALSSRNFYLNSKERSSSLILYKSLEKARKLIESGERNSRKIISQMEKMIREEKLTKIDYLKICDPETLEDVQRIKGRTLIALALWIGKTRLIDNMIVEGSGLHI
jgi:pantoate--beta-alanine ligase